MTTVDEQTVQALAALFNEAAETDGDGAAVGAVYERLIDAAFHAFLLEFRKATGRPMGSREHALTRMAYETAWVEGADLAFRVAYASMDADEDGEGVEP